jgi:D-arginine dehydrogenase
VNTFDIVVIGAGMAGATTAAALAADRRVALVEAEEAAGYHSTGRSAAMWMQNYGPHAVRILTRLSREFLEAPPEGFVETPLLAPRAVIYLAPPDQADELDPMLAEAKDMAEISLAEAHRLVPPLRPDYAVRAALETDAFDVDVASLHAAYLKQLRVRGGTLALRSRTGRIERRDGAWQVETSDGATYSAGILVNASGAWGDAVAAQAGVAPLGLSPMRRTGAIVDPAPHAPLAWPMINDVRHTWYARTEARTKLMVSPADETPLDAHDVQPDELDIAIAIDRMQTALDIDVRRVERSWAGLRTFTPDRSPAFGWDASAEGFFWCVGQGGYGIQTAPAAGALVADLIAGRDPGAEATAILPLIDPARFR